MAATGAASCGVTATGSSRWPMATAAIAGRSFTARAVRDLRILSEAQSSLSRSPTSSPHGDWITPALRISWPSVALAFAGDAEDGDVLGLSASDGASDIAFMGSVSGLAMKTVTPLTTATNPNTTKADA